MWPLLLVPLVTAGQEVVTAEKPEFGQGELEKVGMRELEVKSP